MADEIKADEISSIIRQQIANFSAGVTVSETGTVLSVGDGIAEVYGLEKVMANELLDFGKGAFGLAPATRLSQRLARSAPLPMEAAWHLQFPASRRSPP